MRSPLRRAARASTCCSSRFVPPTTSAAVAAFSCRSARLSQRLFVAALVYRSARMPQASERSLAARAAPVHHRRGVAVQPGILLETGQDLERSCAALQILASFEQNSCTRALQILAALLPSARTSLSRLCAGWHALCDKHSYHTITRSTADRVNPLTCSPVPLPPVSRSSSFFAPCSRLPNKAHPQPHGRQPTATGSYGS